mgnify:CR=1 FL=1
MLKLYNFRFMGKRRKGCCCILKIQYLCISIIRRIHCLQRRIRIQHRLSGFSPVIFYKLFESFICMKNAIRTLTENCIVGIESNKEHCEALLYESVGTVTALCPYLGYKKSAELAKQALRENRRIKDLVREQKLLDDALLDRLLDPFAMTEPSKV